VIVEAVGLVEHPKVDVGTLDRKRSLPLDKLLEAVAFRAFDDDVLSSLGRRWPPSTRFSRNTGTRSPRCRSSLGSRMPVSYVGFVKELEELSKLGGALLLLRRIGNSLQTEMHPIDSIPLYSRCI
jgi:hypothetical protein